MSHHDVSPKSTYHALAPSGHSPSSNMDRRTPVSAAANAQAVSEGAAAQQKPSPDGKRASPQSSRAGQPPKIIVKKEPPSSPEVPHTSRHRPRKLDLSSSNNDAGAGNSSRPSAPLTRDSGNLGMHDVGLACLSPGFQTHDPSMQEQLQRSITVREQQRHIIESRLQKNTKGADSAGEREGQSFATGGLKTPMTSRKRPPPGLSIVPPSHEQFANERVIQSAPLHQSFTGRHQPPHLARHTANDSSHIHHVPAVQTQNRLPPISDVFANEGLGSHREGGAGAAGGSGPARPGFFHSNSASNPHHPIQRRAFPSPGLPPPRSEQGPAPPSMATRPREYRSAEEAVADMTSGREELRPKLVHYGGHQPPTPPSPSGNGLTPNKHPSSYPSGELGRSVSGRRRPRAEYERDGSPPLGSGPSPRRAPFGEGRDSPETNIRKKDEFMRLCARAWDLFHS
ncbi:MAG: hypothetical protein LQ340_007729 [Diploschistes diacapsis]|nr:MAG: hypothetical protein LQ340_007729 [Diploschistes diacapsis]